MSGMINASGLTLDRDGLQNISEIIAKVKFEGPAWNELMKYVSGIKANKQIVIADNFNGLAGSKRSACDITPNEGAITLTEKTWTPIAISDRFEECYDNINDSTFWKKFLKNGVEKSDLTGTPFEEFVMSRLENYLNDDMITRLLWFTNTAIVAGTGNNISAGNKKFFDMMNGLFAQLDVIVSATPARGVTITENSGVSYTAQKFAAASPTVHPVTDYLNEVVYGASIELRSTADAIIVVTQTVMDQYVQERKAVSNIELAYTRTETGMQSITFDGKKMIANPTWDRLINRHFDNGTVLNKPHRILFYSPSQVALATEEAGNIGTITSEYSSFHKKWFADFLFNLDVKCLDDNLFQYGS